MSNSAAGSTGNGFGEIPEKKHWVISSTDEKVRRRKPGEERPEARRIEKENQ
jgi:hypothetical protein